MKSPVCVKCQRDMVPHITGVLVVEYAYNPPEPFRGERADVWKCPRCGCQITAGYPDVEIHQPELGKELEIMEKRGRVVRSFESTKAQEKWELMQRQLGHRDGTSDFSLNPTIEAYQSDKIDTGVYEDVVKSTLEAKTLGLDPDIDKAIRDARITGYEED